MSTRGEFLSALSAMIEEGNSHYIKGDYASATDVFNRATAVAEHQRQEGQPARAWIPDMMMFDILGRLSAAALLANRYQNALNSSIRMTEIVPYKAVGYDNQAKALLKLGRTADAAEALLQMERKCYAEPAEYDDLVQWKRQDPCKKLPFEILQMIFAHLSIKEWTNLQLVSKLWEKYLTTDPYLWATSIDFAVFKKPTCNAHTLKICLDRAFSKSDRLTTPVETVKYLRVGPFANVNNQEKCLEMLADRNFVNYGKVRELDIISKNESELLYKLTPLERLAIRGVHSVRLDELLQVKQNKLQVLSIKASFCKISQTKPVYTGEYPVKILRLNCALSYACLHFLSSVLPDLDEISIPHGSSDSFDLIYFLMAFRLSKLTTLRLSFARMTNLKRIYGLVPPAPRNIPEWPQNLKRLTLNFAVFPELEHAGGSLSGLESLDVSYSTLDLILFMDRFQVGEHILTLLIKGFNNNGDLDINSILLKCPNIESVSLYKTTTFRLSPEQIKPLLQINNKLKTVDISRTTCTDRTVLALAENGVKRIGCANISLSIPVCDRVSVLDTNLLFKELSM